MDYFTLSARGVVELLLVFALGAFVGRVLGYWHYCREMLRRHENVQRVIMPFEERFRSPLDERKWPPFSAPKIARTNRRETTRSAAGEQNPVAFEVAAGS